MVSLADLPIFVVSDQPHLKGPYETASIGLYQLSEIVVAPPVDQHLWQLMTIAALPEKVDKIPVESLQ